MISRAVDARGRKSQVRRHAFNDNQSFRDRFAALAPEVRLLATKNFRLWLHDPRHQSIHFKRVGAFWSARVGSEHRALGILIGDGVEWFWIGPHDEYDRLIKNR